MWSGIIPVFQPYRRYKIPRGTPSAGALNIWEVGKFAFIVIYLENAMR